MTTSVLIVDDEPEMCEMVVSGLAHRGFSAQSRTQATAALDLPRLDTPESLWISTLPLAGDTRLTLTSHYRLPPACGPPCIG